MSQAPSTGTVAATTTTATATATAATAATTATTATTATATTTAATAGSSAGAAGKSSTRTEKTACILCSRNCGLSVEVGADNFVKIRGDDDHPVSKGYICQKAARLQHYQQHGDRLTHPLKRQPDGSFTRVSWGEALDDIAARLNALKRDHGGDAFAFLGGGGQGNHLGGAYGSGQLRAAMKSVNAYNSLGQEKTGDFWLNGRLFGRQTCHTTEDVEHADYVLFIGCNPFQAHGIPNARDVLKDIRKDPNRTMVVVDPRRTETARVADIHLQLRPGTDAFLMSAMLAIIVQEGLHDRDFIAAHCDGFDEVEAALRAIPVADYVARADVPLALVQQVARDFARAGRACLRIDLGIQHTLHTTLNGYLEKLLYLVTGNFGVKGGNNLHSFLLPILGHTDERKPRIRRTPVHGMFPIAGILPPNILPDEILLGGERRIRAAFVDSANPVLTWPDQQRLEEAFRSLELLVVVDVAMSETARLAHYVLPAASQFEKWEATGFNLEFPANFFHLRHPLFAPPGECLPEAEIYTRLLEKMGVLPASFPVLSRIARHEPSFSAHAAYLAGFAALLMRNKRLMAFAPSILYRTLGPTLLVPEAGRVPAGSLSPLAAAGGVGAGAGSGVPGAAGGATMASGAGAGGERAVPAAAAAPLLPLCIQYANTHAAAVRRAGFKGNRLTLGVRLFRAILSRREGTLMSVHTFEEMWGLMGTKDRRVKLAVPEMLAELSALQEEKVLGVESDAADVGALVGAGSAAGPAGDGLPCILMAGERRSYNANQIYRDPAWRKVDPHGALRMHPDDAAALGVAEGEWVVCASPRASLEVVVELDDGLRRGVVTLPHGYGQRYQGGAPVGPELNRLTDARHCDPLSKTPYHKHVAVVVRRREAA